MAGGIDHIPDDILRNMLSRLPAKPMGRCRCVSTHWNRLISDPNFMMSRSSAMIFLISGSRTPIHILDESNGSVTNLDFSTFKIPANKNWDDRFVTIVGTFSGIILLAVRDYIEGDFKLNTNSYRDEHMILYNPFTGVYEIFHHHPYPSLSHHHHAYGFGYGATPDELKIIRFRNFNLSKLSWNTCHVFNLKTRSWSQQEVVQDTRTKDTIGTFLKGYLYWMGHSKILALNVDKMVFSEMHLPDSAINKHNHLGTCNGCLWMITNTIDTPKFDVWVKNEQGVDNSWSKTCSLTIGLEPECYFDSYRIIEITEDGRIIMNLLWMDYVEQMIIYDPSKQSYKLLKSSSSFEEISNFVSGIKYKESLVSPINICRV